MKLSRTIVKLCYTVAVLLGIAQSINAGRDESAGRKSDLPSVDPPNVLFIAIDDLRPELGCYGAAQVKSPNIDELASEGFVFNSAYCNVPVCGASRASLLTGILPTPDRFVRYDTYVENDAPGAETLPQIFKEAGYTTFSFGKVFHHSDDSDENSWSVPAWKYQGKDHNSLLSLDPETMEHLSNRGRGRIYEYPEIDDWQYPDGQTALKTIKQLGKFKESGKPFFIACGFIKPHMPFYAPRKYWDVYKRDSIRLAENQYRPKNAPVSLKGSQEYTSYHLAGMDPNSEEFHRVMKHGYLACVSYIDKLIGDVLAELNKLGLTENTIVVLWGDHGWHLGEHNFWGKHNTMHLSLRIPLIIKVPQKKEGNKCNAIIESVDLLPTLCELAGLEYPEQVHGRSFVELFDDPDSDFREYAYSRFGKGDAVITNQYSFTRYSGDKPEIMLYDLKNDPDENENIADKVENKHLIQKMQSLIQVSEKKASILNSKK